MPFLAYITEIRNFLLLNTEISIFFYYYNFQEECSFYGGGEATTDSQGM